MPRAETNNRIKETLRQTFGVKEGRKEMAAVELLRVKCKTCGLSLDEAIMTAENGVVKCPACANVWTIARKEATPETRGFLQIGEHDLDVGKYDDALAAYEKAAELDPKEPEAFFGMALAEFKIRYLKDHTANRLQPICGDAPDKKFRDCAPYLKAILNATPEQKAEYEKQGEQIDYILGDNDITYKEVLARGLKVMDLTAICMCQDNDLPIYVFNMDVVGNLKKVMAGEEIGTLVHN